MSREPNNDELFSVARAWTARFYAGRVLRRLSLELDDGSKVKLPIPATIAAARTTEPFVPSPLQNAILEALDGKALRTDALAAAADCERRRLFRAGGLKELQDQGLVRNHPRLGYYRPDSPPDEIPDDMD